MPDLFDDEPRPNSPEDLGGLSFVPRAERRAKKKEPKPWHTEHKDHPSQRPENQLQPGETAPTSWNVAKVEIGILHMRKFLAWCESAGIEDSGHTVGTLYVALNAHSLEGLRWLCQNLKRTGLAELPTIDAMNRAILARDAALLYDSRA